jgi:hypothetical protein
MVGIRFPHGRIARRDMVGYSALAQRDEGLALELLEEHRAMHELCAAQTNP